ncbi:cholecystokinin receptor-like [Mercenaria mercenaria]|uniref:cholecystokinin receptor-like n=1 Tax=Mercenaria mercenaria TaxID=6596 RepID=UPI00234F8ECA|nr:cholecystokinin receptor-like [Mercenaria mercenaria]
MMDNLDDIKEHYTGAVVLLAFLMVIGFIGNLHVLFVYTFRLKPSNHGIYILFLSVQDVIACSLHIPEKIYVYNNFWTYGSEFICRFHVFSSTFILTAAAFTLLLIAADRYRKICCPLGWQIKRRIAKLLCITVLISACLCSWPHLVLNVPKTIELNNRTITVCGTVDGYRKYQQYHLIVMATIFLGSLCILTCLYVLILKSTAKYYSRVKLNTKGTEKYPKGISKTSEAQDEYESNEIMTLPEAGFMKLCDDGKPQDNFNFDPNAKEPKLSNCNDRPTCMEKCNVGSKRTSRSKKTTTVFILITVLYFISYFPYIAVQAFLVYGLLTPSLTSRIVVSIVNSFVFINSVVNCFIYSCFDRRFRHEIVVMYKTLWHMCKHEQTFRKSYS